MKKSSTLHSSMMALLLTLAGALSGLVLGFLLVTFTFYIGRSGYTGREYFGFTNPGVAWMLAASGGVPLGAILTPLVFFRYLRGRRASLKWGLLPVTTLLGGLIGAVGGLGLSALLGGLSFWACAVYLSRFLSERFYLN